MTEQYLTLEAKLHGIGVINFMSMSDDELLDLIERECGLDLYNITSIVVHGESGEERVVL